MKVEREEINIGIDIDKSIIVKKRRERENVKKNVIKGQRNPKKS
jgi:hypothetical protein